MVSVTSGWGPGSGAFACPLFSFGSFHCLPLCSSSLLCVASFCSVGFLLLASFLASPCLPFATVFSFGFHLLLSLSASSVPLFLLCSTLLLGSPPVAWWPSVFFWPCSLLFLARRLLFSCLGFSAPRVRVSRWSSTGFPFVRLCFPFFL